MLSSTIFISSGVSAKSEAAIEHGLHEWRGFARIKESVKIRLISVIRVRFRGSTGGASSKKEPQMNADERRFVALGLGRGAGSLAAGRRSSRRALYFCSRAAQEVGMSGGMIFLIISDFGESFVILFVHMVCTLIDSSMKVSTILTASRASSRGICGLSEWIHLARDSTLLSVFTSRVT